MDENIENPETDESVEPQTDDLVIAEAVEVMLTMYSCRFCSKRFDTIDKVKTHFLKRHSTALVEKSPKKDTTIDGNEEQSESVENDSEIVIQNDLNDEMSGQEVEAQEVLNDSYDDNEDINNEEKTEKTTLVIKQQKIPPKLNRSKIKIIETERSIQTRNRLKKDLPSHLELKIVRPDNTAIEMPPKRGRPKKYEVRQSSQLKTATRRYPCPFAGCDYVAKYRSNLWDHKKLHTGEKPYQCNWPNCLSRFPQSQQLKLHLRSHTGERPYACTWPGCELAFSQKPGLKSHMRTHTGEKPYVCDWPGCEWKFRLKGALTDHKKAVHEGLKGFVCEWPGCNKRFLQSCHLRKHMMAHADIKPFACDWPNCNYKAVSMSYVTNHKKTHTGEKNFECGFNGCSKRFVKSSHVIRHQQKCHPELSVEHTIIGSNEEVEVYNITTVEI